MKENAGRQRYELGTGLQLRVSDYMEKPIDPPTLLAEHYFLKKSG